MLALSIRQPWCWFILEHSLLPEPKLYENRDWDDQYMRAQLARVPIGSDFLIHAASWMTKKDFDQACDFAVKTVKVWRLPNYDLIKKRTGGLVGVATLDGVVRNSSSPWFTGPLALRLKNPYPIPFQPCKGQLGFFNPNLNDINLEVPNDDPEREAA